MEVKSWKDRCIVFSPRHAFIRPWIRAYFASGNNIPLVIVPGPPGDWMIGDMEYCLDAAKYSGGMVFDCSREWRESKRFSKRAARGRIGWYSKKLILHAVSTRLSPTSWAWIDDDAEVTGALGECFDVAEVSPGSIMAQFYFPDKNDCRHPARLLRSKMVAAYKLCWNSLLFFHENANRMLSSLNRDFPVEDDECIFCHLYNIDPEWHEGFCDFSRMKWQAICSTIRSIPRVWNGKVLHYATDKNNSECKKMWASKVCRLKEAPFEHSCVRSRTQIPIIDVMRSRICV